MEWTWTGSDSDHLRLQVYGVQLKNFVYNGLAILFAFPIGVGAATYMEEFPKRKGSGWRRYRDFMEININNLAAVPSIVYGLLGLAVLINLFGMPRSASLVGGITLGILILPMIVIASRTALRTVPQTIRDASNLVPLVTNHNVSNITCRYAGIITDNHVQEQWRKCSINNGGLHLY